MDRAEIANNFFDSYNCAQSVLAAYAGEFGIDLDTALSLSVGFGGGIGRLQETCGAVSGAVMLLGLSSRFKQEDGRPKINDVYATVRNFIEDFNKETGTEKCRDLLKCDLSTEEGQKFFKEHNLRENCRLYIRLCCQLLDKYIAEKK